MAPATSANQNCRKMKVPINSSLGSHDSLAICAQQADQHHLAIFGKSPEWIVAAPGRVNLIGEHTDYNDGFVLPMAIERYVVIAASEDSEAAQSRGRTAVLHSLDLEESFEIPLDRRLEPGPVNWSSYVKGVFAGFLERGASIPSIEAVIQSSVPLGGGLSSSAALEVATATLIETILGTPISPVEKALLCQQTEHDFVGVPCGIMDQFCSIFGKEDALMLLDCRSQQIQLVPFTTPDVTILIINSNVKHELAGGEYAKRRQQCEAASKALGISSLRDVSLAKLESASEKIDEVIYRRARHVITENARTLQAADAIGKENWSLAGELMIASHKSLRDDYEVSCKELDLLVELAQEIGSQGGVFGTRMTGGGFGGCTVSLVKTDSVRAITETIRSRYLAITGIEPDIFASRPARGAHVIRSLPPANQTKQGTSVSTTEDSKAR